MCWERFLDLLIQSTINKNSFILFFYLLIKHSLSQLNRTRVSTTVRGGSGWGVRVDVNEELKLL